MMMAQQTPNPQLTMDRRAYSASSVDSHRRAMSYDPNNSFAQSDDESNSIPLQPYDNQPSSASYEPQTQHQLQLQSNASSVPSSSARLGRSLSLFRRQNRLPGQYTQGTVPPIPQVPILQHSGKSASPLLRLDDSILIRVARNLDFDQLMEFSHLSRRCRAITAKTLTLILQRTVLKATLCQERRAVFSLEFIFQHLDPASLQAVFRASQLKSRRYFENSALARPVVQALTLVTPNGSHHPIFKLGGFEPPRDGVDSMTERELERATTLLGRPFELDIKDKGYYRVSPTTSAMVDTPFFPSQPLLDPLVPIVMEGAVHGPPSWEMMYKIDLLPPNYTQRVQQQQEKIYQEQVRQAALTGQQPPPPPVPSTHIAHVASTQPSATAGGGFVPLPAIKSGPNLRSLIPEPSPLSGIDSKDSGKLKRKPTVVRPPPEGWGPLPPVAPPPPVPASMTYQLGTRTVLDNNHNNTHFQTTGGVPMSPTSAAGTAAPSCLEPELAEETERFLTLLFIQFPIQTLFPYTATASSRRISNGNGIGGWMAKSKLGRSLTQKKKPSVDYRRGAPTSSYSALEH
ncbi:hypothetical protein BGZ47_006976 [Haplosporangium gracile]|nr:hypothetical protein BGZ47_006976 [Haplosporangium gracile]